ncbi:MAG TPA: ABC transporter ATP-binding protein [Nitrososphaeraceae archaeon]
MRNPEIVLELKNIAKVYKSVGSSYHTVFDGIDLQIKQGEIVTVLGRSGCGKSTLLNIIAGLDRLYRGELLVEGKIVLSAGSDRAMIFQENALFPWLNVIQNIEFALREVGISKPLRRVIALDYLDMVGLTEFATANIHELSGGMKQRIAIARALVLDPKILLMDEPFAALDIQTRQLLYNELLRIHRETKKTILLVTHNIEEAVILGDRVILLSELNGKIGREFKISIPRPRNLNDSDLKSIVSEVLEEFRAMNYLSKDQAYATTIPN